MADLTRREQNDEEKLKDRLRVEVVPGSTRDPLGALVDLLIAAWRRGERATPVTQKGKGS